MPDHPCQLGARVDRVRRGAASACAAALWLTLATAGWAEGLRVTAPEGVSGTVVLGLLGDDGRLTPVVEVELADKGEAELAVHEGEKRTGNWELALHAEDGRVARVALPGASAADLPTSLRIDEPSLFKPNRVEVVVRDGARSRSKMIALLVTESDGRAYARVQPARSGGLNTMLDDVRPGLLMVHALSDANTSARHSLQLQPGESSTLTLLLSRPGDAGTSLSIAPFLSAGGDLQEGLHTASTLAVFVVVVIVWVLIATCFPAVWTYFGLRDPRARVVLSITAALVGIVLLGNGISLIVLDAVRFVPLISTVGAVQLIFLVLTLPAYLSRKAWVRTLAGLGVVFSLLVTFVFLPSFVFEGEDAGIGLWLTITQIVLVCAMALAVTWLAFTDRRAGPADGAGVCPDCGTVPDPLSGRCRCLPEVVGSSGKRTARLSLLRADGRRSEVVIGPHTVIGSAPDCDVSLSEDPEVEPRHATVELEDGDLYVHDRSQAAGVFVNGARAPLARLHDGDEILIGDTWLVVELL